MKQCTKCKSNPAEVKTWCRSCFNKQRNERYHAKKNGTYQPKVDIGPSLKDRNSKFKDGFLWCAQCKDWLLIDLFPNNKYGWRIHKGNTCKSCCRIRMNERAKFPEAKYMAYKRNSESRNFEFQITFDEFMTLWQRPCFYCGDQIETIGIDRVDNAIGYLLNNCISCCSICNDMKKTLPQHIFFNKIMQIAGKHQ